MSVHGISCISEYHARVTRNISIFKEKQAESDVKFHVQYTLSALL